MKTQTISAEASQAESVELCMEAQDRCAAPVQHGAESGGFFADLSQDLDRFGQRPCLVTLLEGSALTALALHLLVVVCFFAMNNQVSHEWAHRLAFFSGEKPAPPWYWGLINFKACFLVLLAADVFHLMARRPREFRALAKGVGAACRFAARAMNEAAAAHERERQREQQTALTTILPALPKPQVSLPPIKFQAPEVRLASAKEIYDDLNRYGRWGRGRETRRQLDVADKITQIQGAQLKVLDGECRQVERVMTHQLAVHQMERRAVLDTLTDEAEAARLFAKRAKHQLTAIECQKKAADLLLPPPPPPPKPAPPRQLTRQERRSKEIESMDQDIAELKADKRIPGPMKKRLMEERRAKFEEEVNRIHES